MNEWYEYDDMTAEMIVLAKKLANYCQFASEMFVEEYEKKALQFAAEELRTEVIFPYIVGNFEDLVIFVKNTVKKINSKAITDYFQEVLGDCDRCLDEYRKAELA